MGVHVVWATKDSDPYYETHYYRLNTSDSWVDSKTVTDYGDEVGGFPTVTFSTDRVHVSYNSGTYADPVYNQGEAKTRDRYDGTWQTPQLVHNDKFSSSERGFSDNYYLFDFYYDFVEGIGQWHHDLYVKKRTVGGSTWSSATLIEYYSHPGKLISSLKTIGGNVNIIYYAGYPLTIYQKSFDGSSWSSGYSVATISSGYLNSFSGAAVSNDLYVTYKQTSSDYVKYRQYDASPLAPSDFAIAQSANAHPLLSWSKNNEPDIDYYSIEKILGEYGWQEIDQTTDLYYEDVTETYCTSPPPECEVGHNVWYRIKAVDKYPQASIPSEELSTYVNGQDPYKINPGVKVPLEYSLAQNFPNPFNPATKVLYSLQKEGLITIKVYNVLGNEVAVLVNEVKPEGNYEVELNAINLPSGIYFYKMQGGKFIEVKKMILMR